MAHFNGLAKSCSKNIAFFQLLMRERRLKLENEKLQAHIRTLVSADYKDKMRYYSEETQRRIKSVCNLSVPLYWLSDSILHVCGYSITLLLILLEGCTDAERYARSIWAWLLKNKNLCLVTNNGKWFPVCLGWSNAVFLCISQLQDDVFCSVPKIFVQMAFRFWIGTNTFDSAVYKICHQTSLWQNCKSNARKYSTAAQNFATKIKWLRCRRPQNQQWCSLQTDFSDRLNNFAKSSFTFQIAYAIALGAWKRRLSDCVERPIQQSRKRKG